MNNTNFRNPTSLVVAGLIFGCTPAFAEGEVELSGQISRALILANDGKRSKALFVDNANSNSRIRLQGSRDIGNDLKVGFRFEVGYPSNPSDEVSLDESSVSAEWQERHIDLFLDSQWGQINLGQGSGAANGAMEEDLSRTDLAASADMASIGGGLEFRSDDSGSRATIGGTLDNLDFESRYDRLHYESPKLGAVKISVSIGDKNDNAVYELGVRSRLKWQEGDMGVSVGYSTEKRSGNAGAEHTIGGSISYVWPNGYNGTLAYGRRARDSSDSLSPNYLYLKAGYILGPHAWSIDYGVTTDLDEAGDRSSAYGAAYVYSAKKWLDVFAGLKQHDMSRNETRFDTITIATTGMRLKF